MLGKSTFDEIISYLKTLSPSGVELEFISLASIEVGKDPNEMVSITFLINYCFQICKMLEIFEKAVQSNRDCDFVQAMLNNFIKNHSEIIMED